MVVAEATEGAEFAEAEAEVGVVVAVDGVAVVEGLHGFSWVIREQTCCCARRAVNYGLKIEIAAVLELELGLEIENDREREMMVCARLSERDAIEDDG